MGRRRSNESRVRRHLVTSHDESSKVRLLLATRDCELCFLFGGAATNSRLGSVACPTMMLHSGPVHFDCTRSIEASKAYLPRWSTVNGRSVSSPLIVEVAAVTTQIRSTRGRSSS